MKKTLLFAFITVSIAANAQFTKGQKLIGPSLSLSTLQQKNETTTSTPNHNNRTSLGLGVDYLTLKSSKKAIGFMFNYNHTHYNYSIPSRNSTSNNHDFSIGVYQRNIIPIKSKFSFYWDNGIAVTTGFGKSKDEYSGTPTTIQEFKSHNYGANFFVTPGFMYNLKKNLLLDIALNNLAYIEYYSVIQKNTVGTTEYKTTSNSLNANTALNAGSLLNSFQFSLKWILN